MMSLRFVSTFDYYDAEESGIKSYTIRDYISMPQGKRQKCVVGNEIVISRGYTMTTFKRIISHVLYWDNWVIISWKHPEGSKEGE